ncbi:MAG TPA: GNAT family N-acetyltransferase [Saprospiraceae bacterium]|nr:GNAT family N-acetyltransferase [Saprospiraceae bacterium]
MEVTRYRIKTFSDLQLQELYQLAQLRHDIFGIEQHCLYKDLDELDPFCFHIMGFQKEVLVAYTRILPPEIHPLSYVSIGRVIIKANCRKSGEGYKLIQLSIHRILQWHPGKKILIKAQSYLDSFYSQFGFVNYGKYFFEDGIPHQEMLYTP